MDRGDAKSFGVRVLEIVKTSQLIRKTRGNSVNEVGQGRWLITFLPIALFFVKGQHLSRLQLGLVKSIEPQAHRWKWKKSVGVVSLFDWWPSLKYAWSKKESEGMTWKVRMVLWLWQLAFMGRLQLSSPSRRVMETVSSEVKAPSFLQYSYSTAPERKREGCSGCKGTSAECHAWMLAHWHRYCRYCRWTLYAHNTQANTRANIEGQ